MRSLLSTFSPRRSSAIGRGLLRALACAAGLSLLTHPSMAAAEQLLDVTVTGPDGAALANAVIVADFLQNGELIEHQLQVGDEAGRASFLTPSDGDEVALAAYAPGFAIGLESHPLGTGEVRITLETGLYVLGGVVDSSMSPIEGAQVFPLPRLDLLHDMVTGADGIFQIGHLPTGLEGFLVLHPDYARTVVPYDGGIPVAFLSKGFRMHGDLRDAASGEPVQGVVTLMRATPEGDLETPEEPELFEPPVMEGSFDVEHLNPGLYQLTAEAEGFLPATVFLELEGDLSTSVSLHRMDAQDLRVEVSSSTGESLGGAAVMVHEPATNFVALGHTDAHGNLSVDSVPSAPLIVTVMAEGYLDHAQDILPGAPASIVLKSDPDWMPPGTVKIEVLPGGGESGENYWAVLSSARETYRIGSPGQPTSGSAVLEVLPDTYTWIIGSGTASASGSLVVESGYSTDAKLTLGEGRRIEGFAGAGAILTILDGDVALLETEAEPNGRFAFEPLPHDRALHLRTQWEDGTSTWHSFEPIPDADVPPGGVTSYLDPVPGAAGDLELAFVLPDGSPAKEIQVRLTHVDPEELTLFGVVDDDGRFGLTGVPTGRYELDNGLLIDGTQYWWPVVDVVVTPEPPPLQTYTTSTVNEYGYSIGDTIITEEECACNWQQIGPTHSPRGRKVLHKVSTSDKSELADRYARGAAFHSTGARIRLTRGSWGGAFGLGYANATATAASSGRSQGGIKLENTCRNCKPSITGSLSVDMSMTTDASGLVGAIGHLRATAIATASVSGDLQKTFAPGRGASTACGVGNNAGSVQVGGVQVPLPGGNCHSDSFPYADSVGPKTVKKATFQIIFNAAQQSKAVGWGLKGKAVAKAHMTSKYVIQSARCKGKCNHPGGCPKVSNKTIWVSSVR